MDWEDYFPTAIAERGYDYYLQGYVTDLKRTKTQITAIVTGTQDYGVVIDLANGDFHGGACECPYANSHPYCKHMAAVLYQAMAADKPASQQQVSKAPTSCDSLEQTATKLVERATDRQVRDFLSVVLAHDNHLVQLFRTR
ncbi:MAG: SWIM zinc finger family protein [Lactiplantibacillus argentoratensis]